MDGKEIFRKVTFWKLTFIKLYFKENKLNHYCGHILNSVYIFQLQIGIYTVSFQSQDLVSTRNEKLTLIVFLS